MTTTTTDTEIVDENGKGVKLSQPSDSDADVDRPVKVSHPDLPSGKFPEGSEPETFPRVTSSRSCARKRPDTA